MPPLKRVRITRGRWERKRYETVHHADEELIVTDAEYRFLGGQAELLEHIPPEDHVPGTETAYTRSWLADQSHDRLKQIYAEAGGDPDAVDLRSSEAVIDGILSIQSEGTE